MASHWLIADCAQQIERGLAYRPVSEAGNLRADAERLRQSTAGTGRDLEDARNLYKALFATKSAAGVARLSSLLEKIAVADSDNDGRATALLRQLGVESRVGDFRALPITERDLAPAWDRQRLIASGYHPTRIIFGSTGKVGDDRTLPLRFDFGSGIFGFYVPMAASNRLAIADSRRDRTDFFYTWMKTNHSGYHYWAGVYNNQNTYLAPWFLA